MYVISDIEASLKLAIAEENSDLLFCRYPVSISYHSADELSFEVQRTTGTNPTQKSVQESRAHVSKLPTREEIKTATVNLLRRLITLTQTLSPLPSRRDLVMKLEYYAEVTPEDYTPMFFTTRFAEPTTPIQRDMETTQVGSVLTPFHTLTFWYVQTPALALIYLAAGQSHSAPASRHRFRVRMRQRVVW